ncbi:hypothetical protein RND81_08G101900 [Saponaria officinalis]|uniref:Transposase n=1 Tax=Saponaria officinalis TaxID=3572 RepID=A0AAW1J7F6_SAPOF
MFLLNVIDDDGKRTRGKTVLANVWNLPARHHEGGVVGHFCGTIARNGGLCSLSYTRWDYLKKGNKGNNQSMILNEIQRFLYPKILEKWILKSIRHKWRDYKCYLKVRHYSDDANITDLHNNCPEDVVQDQWISLVNFWRSDEGQERSTKSKLSHKKTKTKPIHTSGTKSHARIYEELILMSLYVHERIKEIIAQQGNLEMNLDEDPVAQVLGKDQYGRVRGFGLGVKTSDLSDPSNSGYRNGLNMSANEETTSMYLIRQLKEQMETLQKCVVKQEKTIKNLKRKLSNKGSFGSSDLNSDEYSSDERSTKEEYDKDDNEDGEHDNDERSTEGEYAMCW